VVIDAIGKMYKVTTKSVYNFIKSQSLSKFVIILYLDMPLRLIPLCMAGERLGHKGPGILLGNVDLVN